MTFLIGVLTFFLVANCLLLILLVLVQLPKKDAGAGIAFGAGTADALFGAGSGNALTKITKYATGVFLGLALLLGYLQDKAHHGTPASDFEKKVQQQQMMKSIAPAATSQPATTPAPQPAANNFLTTPAVSNAPAAK
jgi:protein translocase SecG subunit